MKETKFSLMLCFAKVWSIFKPKNLFCFQEIKSIVDTGVNCIVSGGKVGEMALHFCNKFNILVVR